MLVFEWEGLDSNPFGTTQVSLSLHTHTYTYIFIHIHTHAYTHTHRERERCTSTASWETLSVGSDVAAMIVVFLWGLLSWSQYFFEDCYHGRSVLWGLLPKYLCLTSLSWRRDLVAVLKKFRYSQSNWDWDHCSMVTVLTKALRPWSQSLQKHRNIATMVAVLKKTPRHCDHGCSFHKSIATMVAVLTEKILRQFN